MIRICRITKSKLNEIGLIFSKKRKLREATNLKGRARAIALAKDGQMGYGPMSLQAYVETGSRAYGPTGLRAYGPTDPRGYGLTGLRAYGLTGLRARGPTDLRTCGITDPLVISNQFEENKD